MTGPFNKSLATFFAAFLLCIPDSANGIKQESSSDQLNQEPVNDVARWDESEWSNRIKVLSRALNTSGMLPAEYVVSKFKNHEVVLFGEIHEVKENCELVSSLIGPLHQAGVNILFSEFIPSRFNERIKKITTSETYDDRAVIEIFRQRPSPTWGYREYMDIVKAVWQLNRDLDSSKPRFELVGIEDDWNEVELIHAGAAERFKIVSHREQHMTEIVRKFALEKRQKGLVHIGYAHTVRHGIRMAAELEKSHAGKVFQVAAHHEFSGTRKASELTRLLEQALAQSKFKSVGFDVVNSPFADLRDSQSLGFKMMGNKSSFRDLAQGYVFMKPLSELGKVSWVDGFITETTFKDALEIAKRKKWITETPESAKQLDQMIAKRFEPRDAPPKKEGREMNITVCRFIEWSIASSIFLAMFNSSSEPTELRPVSFEANPNDDDKLPSIKEARARAQLLHATIHGSLQVMHRDFFDPEDRTRIPSASLEDVFEDISDNWGVRIRWIGVNAKTMNADHQPRDEFEKDAVKAISAGKKEFEAVVDDLYRHAGSIVLHNVCLKCHVPDRKSLEDRAAGLVISMPVRSGNTEGKK